MATQSSIKLLEVCKVSPSSDSPYMGSAYEDSLPLAFFDLLFFKTPPIEVLYFFSLTLSDCPCPFFESILPKLKHSLSLTLPPFLPLVGKITWPPHAQKPIIHYTPNDVVSLTIAESNANVDYLFGHNVIEPKACSPLIPHLESSDSEASILALQVTHFPNKGFCIGITGHHMVLDGKTMSLILKSWASICKLDNFRTAGTSLLPELTPIIDRTLVKYPATLDSVCINHMLAVNGRSLKLVTLEIQADIGRATFELSRANIEKLRKRVLSWWDKVDEEGKTKSSEAFHLSTFVLTFAYIMVCVVKAKDAESNNKMVCFSFVAHDFRSRLDPPVPANYFGNCVGGGVVVAQARKLMEEVGLAIAAYRISDRIKKMEKGVPDNDRAQKFIEMATPEEPELDSYHPIMVTWSSKFGDYGMDFGWGRPKKVDITTVHKTKATSMVESRNGSGGVEIGMVLKKDEMDHFLLSSSPAYKVFKIILMFL